MSQENENAKAGKGGSGRTRKRMLSFSGFVYASLSVLFLFVACAFGTTYDISALSLSQLTRASDVIVVGEAAAAGTLADSAADVNGVGTTTTIIVREVLKGAGEVSIGQEVKVVTLGRGQIRAKSGERVLLYLNRLRRSTRQPDARQGKSEDCYTLAFEGFGAVCLPADDGQAKNGGARRAADASAESECEEILSAARKYVSLLSSSGQGLSRRANGARNLAQHKNLLIACLKSRNPRVCVSACVDIIRDPKMAEALGKSDGDMDVLIERFRGSQDVGAKDYLARALGATRSSRAVPALIDSLSAGGLPPVARGAVSSVGFRERSLTSVRSSRPTTQKPRVIPTASVARALKTIGDPSTVTQLVRKLRQSKDDASGRVAIVNTIGALGGDMATRSLRRRIRDKDRRVRLAAALALARVNPTEAVASFGRILSVSERSRARGMERQRDPDMQKLAIVALAKIASAGKNHHPSGTASNPNASPVGSFRFAQGQASSSSRNEVSAGGANSREAERILKEFSETHKNEDIGEFAAQALNWRRLWK